jgi:uncharacterized protein (DUF427 family)
MMSARPRLTPGPSHPITVTPFDGRVVVKLAGQVVADTSKALTLQESNYPAVRYLPREDVAEGALERTEHTSYCPYKGDASYYSVKAGEQVAENAIWTYESPYEPVADIKDYVAFYPDRVDSIEETPA